MSTTDNITTFSCSDTSPSGITELPSGVSAACLISLVRAYIGDMDTTSPEFSDTRINQVLQASSFTVYHELVLCTTVCKPDLEEIDICQGSSPNFDVHQYSAFANLVALKAACIINQGIARGKATRDSLRAVCGPATMQVGFSSGAVNALIDKGPCEAYVQMKRELCERVVLNTARWAEQIVSVFTSRNYQGRCGC